jgi:CubicO group peptidase (beta-lactamase class C family)
MNRSLYAVVITPLALGACQGAPEDDPSEPVGTAVQAITGVSAPDFNLPDTAFYCSVTWPNAGGSSLVTAFGDINTRPCAGFLGSTIRRTGMFTSDSWNIAEERCDPNYYWDAETWGGGAAISDVTGWAANTNTQGNCFFKMTIAPHLRAVEDTIGPIDYFSDTANSFPIPVPSAYPHAGKSFNGVAFANAINTLLSSNPPTGYTGPVGYQLSVRAPLTAAYPAPLSSGLVVDVAQGNVVGSQPLPSGSTQGMGNPAMDSNRRFDLASVSKTITAVAVVAAFDDMAEDNNPQQVTLESSINPYLQMIWPNGVDSSVQSVTFRDLLRHTTPFCRNGRTGGDGYAALKAMVAEPPSPAGSDGQWQPGPNAGQNGLWHYCDWNYALLRILLPLVVEGGAAFHNSDGSLKTDAQIDQLTSLAFRNYARGRIFDRIGLTEVDTYNTTSSGPETIYFRADGTAIPDQVNVGVGANSWYDQRSDTTVRSVGSGFWFLSADEYTFFLVNLWAGKIIPHTTVLKMLTPYSLGVELGSMPGNGAATWGKNGAGFAGGPWTQWVTFPDGYTAALFTNSPAGSVDFRTMLQNSYDAARG